MHPPLHLRQINSDVSSHSLFAHANTYIKFYAMFNKKTRTYTTQEVYNLTVRQHFSVASTSTAVRNYFTVVQLRNNVFLFLYFFCFYSLFLIFFPYHLACLLVLNLVFISHEYVWLDTPSRYVRVRKLWHEYKHSDDGTKSRIRAEIFIIKMQYIN